MIKDQPSGVREVLMRTEFRYSSQVNLSVGSTNHSPVRFYTLKRVYKAVLFT